VHAHLPANGCSAPFLFYGQKETGRRTLMLRLVTYLPSRPAKGDVFTMNVMRTVGSSTCTNIIFSYS